jgi:hypothetical protein
MKYIVYQTVCTVNNKIYIGVHSTENPEVFDGYLGCGTYTYRPATYKNPNTPFKCAVKKYGITKFIRTVLKIFDIEEDAYKLEAELVNEEFVRREDTYNLALGGRNTSLANDKKKVYMYTLDGEFEKEFESLREASLYLDPKSHGPGHLPRAIKSGHQYLGHQFSYEKLPYMKKLKCRTMNIVDAPHVGKKVGKFDNDGNLLETFPDMTECVKAGYKNAKQVALGKREHCKGFVFKYLD